jgi:hypothetical protein
VSDEFRQFLCECRKDASDERDKAVMAGAGGALALTIGFLRGTPSAPLLHPWLLALALISLALSYGAVLWSFWYSHKSYDLAIAVVDSDIEDARQKHAAARDTASRVTNWLNAGAVALLCVGVGALAFLFWFNYGRLA